MTILMVHGYNSDLDENAWNFEPWEAMLSEFETERFPWDSGLQGWGGLKRARAAGHDTSYEHAYKDLAIRAADQMRHSLLGRNDKVDAFCHSLGSRVVLDAVKTNPGGFNRVCIIGGAELVRTAWPTMEDARSVEFLNIASEEDDVLENMGAVFHGVEGRKFQCIGNGCPHAMSWLPNFNEVRLEDRSHQAYWRRRLDTEISGDNEDEWGDHGVYYEREGNHELITAFFRGEL